MAVIKTVDGYAAAARHVEAGGRRSRRSPRGRDRRAGGGAPAAAGARGNGSRPRRTRGRRNAGGALQAASSAARYRRSSMRQPSKRSVRSRSAASPRAGTSSMMSRTTAVTSLSVAGRGRSAAISVAPRRSRRESTVLMVTVSLLPTLCIAVYRGRYLGPHALAGPRRTLQPASPARRACDACRRRRRPVPATADSAVSNDLDLAERNLLAASAGAANDSLKELQ